MPKNTPVSTTFCLCKVLEDGAMMIRKQPGEILAYTAAEHAAARAASRAPATAALLL
jgi:hypothetical protein